MASGARGACFLGHDFGIGVGQREDERPVGHGLDHFGLEHAGRREAEEDVGSRNDVGERPRVGLLGIDRLPSVHERGAPFVDDPLDVGDPDVFALGAEGDEEIEAGKCRCAGAGGHDLRRLRSACLRVPGR